MFDYFLNFFMFFKDKVKYFVGYFFQYLLSTIFSVILIPNLAKNIGFSEFGNIGKLISILGLLTVLINYSFNVTSVSKVSQENNIVEKGNIYKKITIAKFFLSIISVFILFVIYYVFDYINFFSFFILSIYCISVSINSIWFLQALENFNLIIITGIIINIISFVLYYLLNKNLFFSTNVVLIFILLPQFLNNIFTYLIANFIQKSESNYFSLNFWELIYSEFSVFFSQFISSIYILTGPLILIYFSNSFEAGVFSIVDRINNLILAGLLMIFSIYMPKISIIFQSNRDKYFYFLKQIFLFYHLIIFLFLFIFLFFKSSILNLLFNSNDSKFSILIYLSLIYILIASLGPMITYHLILSNSKKFILILTSFILTITISSSYFLTQKLGSIGWLLSSIFGQIILVFIFIFILKQKK